MRDEDLSDDGADTTIHRDRASRRSTRTPTWRVPRRAQRNVPPASRISIRGVELRQARPRARRASPGEPRPTAQHAGNLPRPLATMHDRNALSPVSTIRSAATNRISPRSITPAVIHHRLAQHPSDQERDPEPGAERGGSSFVTIPSNTSLRPSPGTRCNAGEELDQPPMVVGTEP
jgi:hypothetical protein